MRIPHHDAYLLRDLHDPPECACGNPPLALRDCSPVELVEWVLAQPEFAKALAEIPEAHAPLSKRPGHDVLIPCPECGEVAA